LTRFVKHSASFFLFVFTAYLLAGNMLKSYSSASAEILVSSKTNVSCTGHLLDTAHIAENVCVAQHQDSKDDQDLQITFCNSSLQMVTAVNNYFLKPISTERVFHLTTTTLVSQLFVLQEPDPPRNS
jgi:hypothetical protein